MKPVTGKNIFDFLLRKKKIKKRKKRCDSLLFLPYGKTVKKSIIASCFLILCFGFFIISSFAEQEENISSIISRIFVNPYGGNAQETEVISFYYRDNKYYLFLPADTKKAEMKIWFSADCSFILDGKIVSNGDHCETLYTEGIHVLEMNNPEGMKFEIQSVRSENIPAVFISTDSGSMEYINESKTNKEEGRIRIRDNGSVVAENDLQYIKSRGNATWFYSKKPYTIKFKEKCDVLGMGKAKKWTLLANAIDPTLIRNDLGWFLSETWGLQYTSDYRHVDLYANGEYLGDYTICESVEVDGNRVDIHDLQKENESLNGDLYQYIQKGSGENGLVLGGSEKGSQKWFDLPSSPAEIQGGYLLEFDYEDRYDEADSGFVTQNGQCVVIKSPERASKEEVKYISSFVGEMSEALYSQNGYNQLGHHYSEYVDMDSFVTMYLIREFANDIDAGLSSTYFYKDTNSELMYASPIWDMDRTFGDYLIRFDTNYGDPTIWWANSLAPFKGVNKVQSVFSAAFKQIDFREYVYEKWRKIRKNGFPDSLFQFMQNEQNILEASIAMNDIRWNTYDTDEKIVIAKRIAMAYDSVTDFIRVRVKSLDKGFSEESVMLYYDANGGAGSVFNRSILHKGESTIVSRSIQGDTKIIPPSNGLVFSHWNTEKNGSGQDYYPGDPIEVQDDTTLYAIWEYSPVIHLSIREIKDNGDILLNLSSNDLSVFEWKPGDLLYIISPTYEGAASLFTGDYASNGEIEIYNLPDQDCFVLVAKGQNTSEYLKIAADAEISAKLLERDGAWDREAAGHLVMRESKEEYSADEEFGNFRSVATGEIADGVLYRSSDPTALGEKGAIIDRMMEKQGILSVFCMAYSIEDVAGRTTVPEYVSPYYKKLLDEGNVYAEKMPYSYNAEGFSDQIAAGFSFLAKNNPPYLIHCHGGKDRTGFAVMILEMLMGATKNEIIQDYMETYVNMYGIVHSSGAYNIIQSKTISQSIDRIESEFGESGRPRLSAINYLLACGMSKEDIDLLTFKLSGYTN